MHTNALLLMLELLQCYTRTVHPHIEYRHKTAVNALHTFTLCFFVSPYKYITTERGLEMLICLNFHYKFCEDLHFFFSVEIGSFGICYG